MAITRELTPELMTDLERAEDYLQDQLSHLDREAGIELAVKIAKHLGITAIDLGVNVAQGTVDGHSVGPGVVEIQLRLRRARPHTYVFEALERT